MRAGKLRPYLRWSKHMVASRNARRSSYRPTLLSPLRRIGLDREVFIAIGTGTVARLVFVRLDLGMKGYPAMLIDRGDGVSGIERIVNCFVSGLMPS